MTETTYRVRKAYGSMPHLMRVLWVDHTNGTVGGVFRDLYGVDFCEAVQFDELTGDISGMRMTDGDLLKYLEQRATVVIRDPNV